MYIYFDSTGSIKEIVNDSKARKGSDKINRLYFYFEDGTSYTNVALTIKYPDGTTSTPYIITSNIKQVIFPQSINKLSYFVVGKQYPMYYYDLAAGDLAQSGMCSATVVGYHSGDATAYGLFTFQVEASVLAENITLTQTDLTYILEQIANLSGDISVFVSPSEPTSIVSTLGRSQDPLLPTTLGENSVELGKNAEASANGSVALGEGVTASGINSIAIGNYSIASGQGATAMASGTASGQESFAFGYSSQATNSYSIAFGTSSSVTSSYAIGIGVSTSVTGSNGIAIGRIAQCTNSNGIAIGGATECNGMGAIAFGYNAKSTNAYDIAIGNRAKASGSYSGAIGEETEVTGMDSMAYGYKAKVTSQHAIQLGQGTNASDNSLQFRTRKIIDYNASRVGQEYSFAILSGGTTGQVLKKKSNTDYDYEWGDGGSAETVYVSTLGTYNITTSISDNTDLNDVTGCVLLGYDALTHKDYATLLGASTYTGLQGTALGFHSTGGDYSTALGSFANAVSHGVAAGFNSHASGDSSTSIGYLTFANNPRSTALGYYAQSKANDAIQLGQGSNTQASTLQFRDIVIADGSTNKLAVKISSSIDPSTYVMTLNLLGTKWDSVNSVYNDVTLSTTTIDLPLEEMVISGSYDDNTQSIILTLKSGQTVTIPVSDLVSGLQTQSNVLDALSLLPTNQTGLINFANGVASLDNNYIKQEVANNPQTIKVTENGPYPTTKALRLQSPNTNECGLDFYGTYHDPLLGDQPAYWGTLSIFNNYLGTARVYFEYDADGQGSMYKKQMALMEDIPTVNNATIAIKNGATILGSFGVNASSNVEIDISSALDNKFTYKGSISQNILPANPNNGDLYTNDTAGDLTFVVGVGGELQAIQVNDAFQDGDYVYFDNTISDADMLTFLQGLTYVDGTCDLVTCEDDQSQTKALITAISMDISEDPEDPQYIYALACYSLVDDSVVWISDGSAMGLTSGWQPLTAEGGLLLSYPDNEQYLTVTALNTIATGWNGVILGTLDTQTLTIHSGDSLWYGNKWRNLTSPSYVDSLVGDINSILDAINGEVI